MRRFSDREWPITQAATPYPSMVYTQRWALVAGRNYLGLRRQKAPRLLDMLKALKAGGDQFNTSGDTNEQQKGVYPY
jgi:hypothetical protein